MVEMIPWRILIRHTLLLLIVEVTVIPFVLHHTALGEHPYEAGQIYALVAIAWGMWICLKPRLKDRDRLF